MSLSDWEWYRVKEKEIEKEKESQKKRRKWLREWKKERKKKRVTETLKIPVKEKRKTYIYKKYMYRIYI